MSNSNNENNNFETLYNNLKEEYEQSKKDNDEICKEYEATIQLLTDSVESIGKEKKDLQTKLSKIENEQKSFKREKDNLIKKNKDKMIDIQCLNEQNDKLNKIIKKLKEDKSLFDTKIVSLENDIDHYQNKIREYEDFIDELKTQLEDALEDNLTLQTEFETYKLNTGEELIRKEEELRDIRNDITNKEKIIQRLAKNPSFNIQKEQEKLIHDKKLLDVKRRLTVLEKNNIFKFNRNYKKHLTHFKESKNENNNKEKTKNKYDFKGLNVIMENNADNKKSYFSGKKHKEKRPSNENSINNSMFIVENKNDSDIKLILDFNDDSENNNENNTIEKNEKIDNKENKENEENEENKDNNNNKENKENNDNKDNNIEINTKLEEIIEEKNDNLKMSQNENKNNDLSSIINKQFDDLVICEENKIYVNPLVHKLLTKKQKKQFKMSLKNMLNRIKERKNNLNNKKKSIKEQLEIISMRIK